MKLAFASILACGALLIAIGVDAATPAKAAQGACSYQACFSNCTKNGKTGSVCARGCARRCYN
jgi:hypothetical protein